MRAREVLKFKESLREILTKRFVDYVTIGEIEELLEDFK